MHSTLAIGAEYAPGTVHIDWTASENVKALAKAKGVPLSEITAIVLDRPRHAGLIEELRTTGGRQADQRRRHCRCHPCGEHRRYRDRHLSRLLAARQKVLAAAALRCIGGQMQGKLILDTQAKRERAFAMGIEDPNRIYDVTELASGDVLVAATGITDGTLLEGKSACAEIRW